MQKRAEAGGLIFSRQRSAVTDVIRLHVDTQPSGAPNLPRLRSAARQKDSITFDHRPMLPGARLPSSLIYKRKTTTSTNGYESQVIRKTSCKL